MDFSQELTRRRLLFDGGMGTFYAERNRTSPNACEWASITNPMEMPTTIGRVVAFGETQCDKAQKQTIQLLAQWLRDDYEQSHPQEIEAMAETEPLVVIKGDVNGDVIERGGTKNENNIDKEE